MTKGAGLAVRTPNVYLARYLKPCMESTTLARMLLEEGTLHAPQSGSRQSVTVLDKRFFMPTAPRDYSPQGGGSVTGRPRSMQ